MCVCCCTGMFTAWFIKAADCAALFCYLLSPDPNFVPPQSVFSSIHPPPVRACLFLWQKDNMVEQKLQLTKQEEKTSTTGRKEMEVSGVETRCGQKDQTLKRTHVQSFRSQISFMGGLSQTDFINYVLNQTWNTCPPYLVLQRKEMENDVEQ